MDIFDVVDRLLPSHIFCKPCIKYINSVSRCLPHGKLIAVFRREQNFLPMSISDWLKRLAAYHEIFGCNAQYCVLNAICMPSPPPTHPQTGDLSGEIQ